MLWLRRLLSALVVCASLASASIASAQTSPAVGAAAPDTAALKAIESQVQQIRGLQPLSDPDLRFVDHPTLVQYLNDQFEQDYLPHERESDQKAWVALGLLKSTDNLVQIQLDLLSDQVVGVYDSDDKFLLVVSDKPGFGPAERMTYAHEFNHFLQDQHFDLNSIAPKHPVSNDQSLAVHALIEGDAILLQTLWAQANLTQEDMAELARSAAGSDSSLSRVPLVVRGELLFPYIEGFNFVRQAYRAGGNSYAAVDELFKNPPVSTSQLLHPDKYRNQVLPVDVQLPDLVDRLGPAYRKVGAGVLGELDTRILLEQWSGERAEAVRVAAGWAGDRWQLVEKDGRAAIVVKWAWESPDQARDFFSAYSRGLRTRFDAAITEESSRTRQALTTPVTATDLRLEGNDVLAVLAFDRDTANQIAGAVTISGL
jgi:hypothetical protein